MHRIVLVLACLGIAALPASAQQTPKTIKREESKLVLDMPGLEDGQELYQYNGWDTRYSEERHYAAQAPKRGSYPRAQVYMTLLAPGYLWTVNRPIDEEFVRNFAPFFKDKTIRMVTSAPGGGNATQRLARFEIDSSDCLLFVVTDGLSTGSGFGAGATSQSPRPSVRGIYCSAPGVKLGDADIAAVLAGYHIVLNPGVVAPPRRTAPAAAAPPPPPKAAPAVIPRLDTPGLIGWSAVPGTRFVTRNGYFQMVRAEGSTMVTVNAGNRTARWVAGLIVPRNAARVDSRELAPLLPLAVGKETSFEEKGSGDDRWRYTIRVERRETVVVQDRSYEAFVVVMRDQSVNPDQGGVDRTRTAWISPEAGGILRYVTRQDSGPSIPSFNFEVIEIIPPDSAS